MWEFLGIESERGCFVCWPNNKIIDRLTRSMMRSSKLMMETVEITKALEGAIYLVLIIRNGGQVMAKGSKESY